MSQICLLKPPDIFVGREKELARLKQAFLNHHFLVIDGIAGIGKTSLALTLANIINDDPSYSVFSNNVFWIECNEEWQLDNLLYEINRWFKYIGNSSFEQFLEDERMELKDRIYYLLDILNKNSYVIFIDDYQKLAGAESVLLLEKFKQYLKKSKVIIISREKPELSPVIWLETFEQKLKGLDNQDVNKLIKELLELHDETYILEQNILDKLGKTTKGHPLLIKTLLCILLSEGHSIMNLLEDVPSFQEATNEYLLSQIITNLKKEERELLFACSLFRMPVRKEAFRYVYPCENIDKVTNNLHVKFLFNRYSASTYLIHDLIRDFCYASLSPDSEKELHRKCSLYYEYIMKNHNNNRMLLAKEIFYHYTEGGETLKASEVLEGIMDEMLRYLQLKELEQYIDKIPPKHRSNKINLMKAELFFIRGDYKTAMELLKSIKTLSTDVTRTEVINLKAKCNLRLGNYKKAMKYTEINIKICKELNARLCLIKALETRGIINFELRHYEEALNCFKKAIDVNNKESSEFEVSLYLFMGMTLEHMGKTEEALEMHLNCFKLAEKTSNFREIPGIKINIGWDYYQLGKLDVAADYLQKGLELAHTDPLRVYSLYFMGLLYEEKDEYENALSNFFKALEIARDLGDIEKQIVVNLMLVKVCLTTGKYEEAKKIVRELETVIDRQQKYIKGEYLIIRAEVNLIDGHLSEAQSLLRQVMDLCNGKTELFQLCRARYFMSLLASVEKDKTTWKTEAMKLETSLFGNEKRKILTYYSSLKEFFSDKHKQRVDKYLVKIREKEYETDIIEIEKLKNTGAFDILIDVTGGTVREKNKGVINFASKTKLSSLLFYLVKNAGKSFSTEDLYSTIWKKKFDKLIDRMTVKTSISRLRKLLEYDPDNPRYVRTNIIPYLSESRYYFPEEINFCLIEHVKSQE